MRAPLSWLGEYVDLPPSATGAQVAADLVRMGLEEEALHGGDVRGPIVVGRVLDYVEEAQTNGKVIRWCQVDVGANGQQLTEGTPQGVVCGARNFEVGDLVVVVLPGAVLPGNFPVGARKTYGHVSNGMICSVRELSLGADHEGILVLDGYLSPDDLADVKPGDDAIALLGLAEEVVEVTVTPDRGYCFSLRGIAREYAHATGGRFHDPVDQTTVPPPNDTGYAVQLTDSAPIHGRDGCDRYVARVVRGVDASAPSPAWLGRRLTQMGMRPISLAVDVTNYVMLAVGQPLHAFDLDRLNGPIVVRRAAAGEVLTTLDDVERRLDPEDLLITDSGDIPLAIAGVMGGATSEVGPKTRNVLVESAHFDPVTVARSSRRHKLLTEASKRFERGVDPEIAAAAARLALDLLVRYGGGVVDPGVTDVDHRRPIEPVVVDTRVPASLVGLPYTKAEVVESLQEIGCAVTELDADPDRVTVLPPTWRPDLDAAHDADFAEEVARLRGYDRIPSLVPQAPGGRGLTHAQRVRRTIADALADAGHVEVLTYPFVSARSHDDLGLPPDDPRRRALRVANPLSEEAPLMRTSVLSTLVEAVRRNVSRGIRDVAVFEVGLVTLPSPDAPPAPVPSIGARPSDETLDRIRAAVPDQPRRLAIAMTGLAEPAGWWGSGRPADWSDVVEAAQVVARSLGLRLVVSADEHAPWHPGRCARLSLPDGTLVGHAGELHPKAVAALELPPRTVAAELDVATLAAASDRRTLAQGLSTYPMAHSDVALTVREVVAAGAVEAALRHGAGELLESVRMFDIYRGEQLPGHKSLAYRLEFRAPDRTLTTDEVSALRDEAIAAAAKATGATQRGA